LWLDGSQIPHPARNAIALDLPNLYSVRAVRDPSGRWMALGFVQEDEAGGFAGRISDPIPLDSVIPPSIRVARH